MKNAMMNHAYRLLMVALLVVASAAPALSASWLPPGKTCFYGSDGAPLASGTAAFYVPGTMSPKDTWTTAEQTALNTNPVSLDASGCALIFGNGSYRQILKDSSNVQIWDQVTAGGTSLSASWGGTSGGSANAQTVALDDFNLTDGQVVNFLAGLSNTTAMTLNVNSTGAVQVVRDSGTGPVALTGGEIVVGNVVSVLYVEATGQFHIMTPTPISSFDGSVFFTGVVTPTILASDQNDWTPPGNYSSSSTLRISSTISVNISGLTGGAAGRTLFIHNVGSNNITFLASSSLSLSANQFLFAGPLILRPNENVTLQYDGVSSGWRTLTQNIVQPIPSSYSNLLLTNGGTPNSQGAGSASFFTLANTNNTVIRLSSLSCTADITASGAGGLDTGSVASNTWYSYWFIYNPSSGTTSCLWSTASAFSSLTLPSGYTFAGRVGWMRTDGSSNFYRTRQSGNTTNYVVVTGTNMANLRQMVSGTTSSAWSATAVANYVPTTASQIGVVVVSGGANVGVAPTADYGALNSTSNPAPVVMNLTVSSLLTQTVYMVLSSANIYYASSGATGYLYVLGWVDNL